MLLTCKVIAKQLVLLSLGLRYETIQDINTNNMYVCIFMCIFMYVCVYLLSHMVMYLDGLSTPWQWRWERQASYTGYQWCRGIWKTTYQA